MFQDQIVSEKLDIQASVEVVWSILVDLEKYGEWNPFTPRMESTLIVGDPITIYVQMNAKTNLISKEKVSIVEPYQRLSWHDLYPRFFLSSQRIQELAPTGTHSCTYHSHEIFGGLATPFIVFAYKKDIQRGFEAVAQSLKKRAEGMV